MTTVLEVDDATTAPQRPTQFALGLLLFIGGAIGLIAAFTLTWDKLEILKNPDYVPNCDVGSFISCSNIMKSAQAEVFGFPNPLIGLMTFPLVIFMGVLVLSKVRLPEWIWAGFQVGVILGAVFVHWLIYQSLFEIKFLCPYCMVVWSMVIPIFVYVTRRNFQSWAPHSGVTRFLTNWHGLIVSLWFVAVAGGIVLRFSDTIFS
ncbi:MAG: Vitamin epoxide reductase [Nocardioidaceae bacterium]|nr:Vitamin epoxide reductase [Nocardioidaceae bacterium]